MTWLLNNLEEKISDSVMFLTTVKEMCDTLKVLYDNEKNSSRVFEIYERLFEFKHEDRSVSEFYGELKGLIDERDITSYFLLLQVTRFFPTKVQYPVIDFLSSRSPA